MSASTSTTIRTVDSMAIPLFCGHLFVCCSRDANHAASGFGQQRRPPIVSTEPAPGRIYQVTLTGMDAVTRRHTACSRQIWFEERKQKEAIRHESGCSHRQVEADAGSGQAVVGQA